MSHDPPQHDFQRARSEAQKQERRRDILRAARQHLADAGLDGFSMGPLAAAAGISRAALYLYYSTREEVLLAVYLEETRAWLADLTEVTGPGMDPDAYLRAVFTTATRRPLFLDLAPRVGGGIETNVSLESLLESKRVGATLVAVAGQRTALALGRPMEQGIGLATGLFALLLGVSQAWRAPEVDVSGLPAEAQQLLEGEDPLDAFLRVGRWLVQGSR